VSIKSVSTNEWDFPDEGSHSSITSLHPYPGRFIPAIPNHAISKYLGTNSGKHILDPFAGCGTTLVSGKLNGHRVTGIDASPLASLLQRCYTMQSKSSTVPHLQELHEKFEHTSNSQEEFSILEIRLAIPNLNHWFSEQAVRTVDSYLSKVNQIDSQNAKEMAMLALSRVLVRLSHQQSDTQYRAINNEADENDIRRTICNSLNKVIEVIEKESDENGDFEAKIIHGDSRMADSFKSVNDVDLVITSPPYPNAYEYWLYHKYRMFWLGMDPIWLRTNEIGVRPHYSGSGKKGPEDYRADMEAVWENLDNVCNIDATQVWIVGDSVIKGELVDTAKLIIESAAKFEWILVERNERVLPRNRSSFQGIGRQNREEVLTFKRKDD
jgi:hypothetical protein